MVRGGNPYERELKGILGGDEDILRRVTKTTTPTESASYLLTRDRPFLVVRAAGSLGVDLVALRGDVSFPIEVKSAAEDVLRFSDASGKNQIQAEAMSRACSAAGIIPLYAFRRKGAGGDAWRLFALPTEGLSGRVAVLYERLPKAARGPSGAFILRWADGFPLAKFLQLLCAPEAPRGAAVTATIKL